MKKFLFLMMALVAIIINSTVASPEAKNKGSSNNAEEMIVMPISAEIVMPTAVMPANNYWVQQQNSSSNLVPKLGDAAMNNTGVATDWSLTRFMTILNSSNASMSTTEMTQWRNLDAINNNSTGLTSTLVALKIWPTSVVDNNVVTVNMKQSILLCYSFNMMSSSLNSVQVT